MAQIRSIFSKNKLEGMAVADIFHTSFAASRTARIPSVQWHYVSLLVHLIIVSPAKVKRNVQAKFESRNHMPACYSEQAEGGPNTPPATVVPNSKTR